MGQRRAISKRLSYVLRHRPDSIGIHLDAGGWVDVEDLLAGLATSGTPITRAELDDAVRRNDKQRFSFDETRTRIRANQGHSVEVDLGLEPSPPPDVLFHGTVAAAVPSILESGLHRAKRHHVHLSPDVATALRVGRRRGSPVVLRIDAAAMHAAGHLFFESANGVWLTDQVPPRHLSLIT